MSKSGLFSRKSDAETNTGTPAPRSGAALAAPASRIPTQPRERRPGVAAFAVMITLACALGAVVLVRQAGEKISAVEVTARVAPGQHIPADAISEVLISKDSGLKVVPWAQRDLVTSRYYTAAEIPQGTLLTGPMLTDTVGVAGDQAIVGLSLKAGEYPPGLKAGDRVRVMWVGRDAAAKTPSSASSPAAQGTSGNGGAVELASSATIHEVFRAANGDVSSALSLSVVVPAAAAGGVTQAASSGDVALVLLPAAQ